MLLCNCQSVFDKCWDKSTIIVLFSFISCYCTSLHPYDICHFSSLREKCILCDAVMLWLTAWLTVWSLFTSPLLYVTHAPLRFIIFIVTCLSVTMESGSGLSSSCPWVVEPGRPVLVGANWRAEQTAGEELSRGATEGNTEKRKTDNALWRQDGLRCKDHGHHCISRNDSSLFVNVTGWWNNVENILIFIQICFAVVAECLKQML